jgi:hypothetical protein
MKAFLDWYKWVKDNDLPNTLTVFVTSILWPVGLIWWRTRKVNRVRNLLVSFMPAPSPIIMNGVQHPAVNIQFENQTPSILYLTGPRIRNCSKLFPTPATAVRDVGENVHPLSFLDNATGAFKHHQTTLQTNDKAQSTIAVAASLPQSFYLYNTPWLRRFFRPRKYFMLEYHGYGW